jgi:hypothetical protein
MKRADRAGLRNRLAATALAALAAPAVFAQPASLHGSRITVETVAGGGLGGAIRRLGSGRDSRWIAWAAPVQDPRRQLCCFEGMGSAAAGHSGLCRLDRERSYSMNIGDETSNWWSSDEFFVFVRVRSGDVERVKSFSPDCRIETGSAPVVWLEDVAVAESVAWLEALARRQTGSPGAASGSDEDGGGDDGDPGSVGGPATAAIALTAGAQAQAALDRMIAPGEPRTLRKKASFWLAAARGAAGCRRLSAVVPSDTDPGFRKHGTFALSLCPDDGGTEALLRMAKQDTSPKVRSQALFWLAQHAGRRVSEALDQAIRDDPDTEVKKQAVFAFSQMPDGAGIPELIRVARTNRNPEVRERAMFWLGQSNDPRALDFIEEILTKR